ncbi:hypothetical protein ACSSV8_002955, partial [Roseovarius sp. MBR-79]
KSERTKVADFYAARDNTMPPLPWPSIAPPITIYLLISQRTSINPVVQVAMSRHLLDNVEAAKVSFEKTEHRSPPKPRPCQ